MKKVQRTGIILILIAALISLCDPAMNAGPRKSKKKASGQRAKVEAVADDYRDKWAIVEGHDSKGKPRSAISHWLFIMAVSSFYFL